MPDSSDQTIRRLQQENKKLKKTLEQKSEELDLERGLWKTRHDINIPVDADRAALLHRLETLYRRIKVRDHSSRKPGISHLI